MASAANGNGPVLGRVDATGRLVAADAPLAALQADAGSRLGAPLALPQLASLVRLVRSLGIPISRGVIAAAADHDLDLWVRATPEGDGVALRIEGWARRPAPGPRLSPLATDDQERATTGRDDGWSTDAELRVTELSPSLATLLGTTPAKAIGQPLTRLLRLVEDDDGLMPLVAALGARSPFAGQRAQQRGGEGEVVLLSGEVVHGPDGSFAGYRGHAAPEAAPIPAPATAAGIDRALDQALLSPLDRIIASADKIVSRDEGPLRSDYAAYAGDIAAAGRHLLSVIRAMGEGAAGPDRIDLAALAAEAAGLVKPAADARGIRIHHGLEGEPLTARGDARGVVQILVNLIGNAVRHSPDGAAVWLRFESGAEASVTVADQGGGIDPADHQRIFERFEQAGDSAAGGTGLGLAIARRLARSMGGDISLDSALGQGARFRLSLPAA